MDSNTVRERLESRLLEQTNKRLLQLKNHDQNKNTLAMQLNDAKSMLQQLRDASSTYQSSELEKRLQNLYNEVKKLVNLNTHVMKSFERGEGQAILDAITQMRQRIEKPRTRFAFKEKTIEKSFTLMHTKNTDEKVKEIEILKNDTVKDDIDNLKTPLKESRGFSAQQNKVLTAEAHLQDVYLSNLSHCVVVIWGTPTQLRVNNLDECVVCCSPIAGSVLLIDAKMCIFHLTARQIRVHSSSACQLYLHTISRPIIEQCTDVQFAPYAFTYPSLQQNQQTARISVDINLWDNVDDFHWLRKQQSPHWSVLPESARRPITIDSALFDRLPNMLNMDCAAVMSDLELCTLDTLGASIRAQANNAIDKNTNCPALY